MFTKTGKRAAQPPKVTRHPVWRSQALWINKRWPWPGEGWVWIGRASGGAWGRGGARIRSKAKRPSQGEAESAPGWGQGQRVPSRVRKGGLFYRGLITGQSPCACRRLHSCGSRGSWLFLYVYR